MFSRNHDETHLVRIEITKPTDDILRRISLLNTTLLRVLTGTRLIRLVSADYTGGCIEVVVEADRIRPPIAPGAVSVTIDPCEE